MNLYDFLIIYFACGAPVGVYYFLQNRHRSDRQKLLLKTFLAFAVWMPFLWKHFRDRFKNNFGGGRFSDAKLEEKIRGARARLEKSLAETNPNLSIYEIREVFDRYASLTLSSQIDDADHQSASKARELFQIAGHNNSELAAICLERRNRKELIFHHTLARADFLDLLVGNEKLAAAIEFVSLLNDAQAKEAIEKMQTVEEPFVKNTEKQSWNSETHKPAFTKTRLTRLKALTATTSLRNKD
jgi:hypothetical protein